MRSQRKQFIKERKNYEKLLKTKAKLGILSLPEKEQYQSMLYSQRRNRLLKRERLIGFIATIGIGTTMLILFYVRPYFVRVNNKVNERTTSEQNIKQGQYGTSYKKEIVEKIEMCIDLNHKANEYFNQGITEYNQDHRVGISHIDKLTALYDREAMAEFNTLKELFKFKLDKQIDILNRLENPEERTDQIKKEIGEIRKLDEVYQEAIYEILDREGIQYIKK